MFQAGDEERLLVDLLQRSYESQAAVELELRHSAFWSMDDSQDELAALICGLRLG